jgi:hypothetical protein
MLDVSPSRKPESESSARSQLPQRVPDDSAAKGALALPHKRAIVKLSLAGDDVRVRPRRLRDGKNPRCVPVTDPRVSEAQGCDA